MQTAVWLLKSDEESGEQGMIPGIMHVGYLTNLDLIVRRANVRKRSDLPSPCRALSSRLLSPVLVRPPLVFLREAFPVTLCRHGYLFPVSRDHENRRVQFIRTWKVSLLAACVQCRLPEEALPLAGIVSGSERSDVPAGIWQTIGIEPMVILMTLSHPAALEAFRQPPFKSIAPIPFFYVMWAALADVKRRDVPQSARVCHFCT